MHVQRLGTTAGEAEQIRLARMESAKKAGAAYQAAYESLLEEIIPREVQAPIEAIRRVAVIGLQPKPSSASSFTSLPFARLKHKALGFLHEFHKSSCDVISSRAIH